MHTPGRMYVYVCVLQFSNFCNTKSIFVLFCGNLPENIYTVSIKKKNTLRSQALVTITYSQIQGCETCLNPWKLTAPHLGRVMNVCKAWLIHITQVAFSFCEKQIIKVTLVSWPMTDSFFCLVFFFLLPINIFVSEEMSVSWYREKKPTLAYFSWSLILNDQYLWDVFY